MSSAISIAAGGLQTAARSFETAARTIVAAGNFQAGEATPPAPKATPTGKTQSPPPASPVFDTPDLGQGLIDLKLAEISYKAQVEVLKVASSLEDEAIDLLA